MVDTRYDSRDGGSCSARLACKLGEVGREAQDGAAIMEAVNLLVPDRYSNFTASFEQVWSCPQPYKWDLIALASSKTENVVSLRCSK